jgi:hypothetical protein
MDENEVSPLAALADADPLAGMTPEALVAQARKFTDPKAKFRAAAAAIHKPSSSFSEEYGNGLAGYNAGADKEEELVAKYLPVVQQAALNRQKQQQLQMQEARKTIDANMASMLTQPNFSPETVNSTLQALVQQGRVPAQMAQQYARSLPRDPAQLKGYIYQQALASTDPYRALAKPTVEKYGEGEVGFAVDPMTGVRTKVAEGGAKGSEFTRLMEQLTTMDPSDPRRPMVQQMLQKMMTHPPQAQTIINPDKKFVDVVAGGLGEQTLAARARAESAVDTLHNARALNEVLKNPVFLGPAGAWSATLARVVGTDQKKLEATSQAVRLMAQSELDAAATMKGQGAMSDAERALVKRVAFGDQTLTVGEVRSAVKAAETQARRRITGYNRQAATLSNIESVKSSGIAPLFAPIEDPYPAREMQSKPLPPADLYFDSQGRPVKPPQ